MQRSSGEELSKSTLIVHVFIAEKIMNLKNLHSTMLSLVAKVVRVLQQILYPLVGRATKVNVVVIGLDGQEKHLEVNLIENN